MTLTFFDSDDSGILMRMISNDMIPVKRQHMATLSLLGLNWQISGKALETHESLIDESTTMPAIFHTTKVASNMEIYRYRHRHKYNALVDNITSPSGKLSFLMTHKAVVYGMCVWSTATFFLIPDSHLQTEIEMKPSITIVRSKLLGVCANE